MKSLTVSSGQQRTATTELLSDAECPLGSVFLLALITEYPLGLLEGCKQLVVFLALLSVCALAYSFF